jgi:hypothetical protein
MYGFQAVLIDFDNFPVDDSWRILAVAAAHPVQQSLRQVQRLHAERFDARRKGRPVRTLNLTQRQLNIICLVLLFELALSVFEDVLELGVVDFLQLLLVAALHLLQLLLQVFDFSVLLVYYPEEFFICCVPWLRNLKK